MELDFETVKALSSPTRLEILNAALEEEVTPTDLSEKVGRSKSTVSSHLEKLDEAGLVEKESEEGRRRVVYQPTDKTKAIVEGRSRKVKFSILSSVSTAWIGLGLGIGAFRKLGQKAVQTGSSGAEAQALGAADYTARESAKASGTLNNPENLILFAGLGFLSISIAGLIYGLLVSRLKPQ
jgi:DNA-binding transcriptional ArsR family regulator